MSDAKRKIEPTLDEPTSAHAIDFQKDFDKNMINKGIHINEVDGLLTEKEQSLKKKIFNLAKMESLVHADPKLSAVYDEMAENGEEKYGYHYNETIMNMIFNDYVLNSAKYLQKYKQAIPHKKKRRNKSGINALRKGAEEIEKKREVLKKEKQSKSKPSNNEGLNESTGASNAGAFSTKAGDKENHEANQIDTDKEWADLNNPEVSEIAKEKKMKDKKKSNPKPVDKDNYVGGSSAKPSYPGGKVVKNPNNTLNESVVDDLDTAKDMAQKISSEEGVVQHVNLISNGKYLVGDWFDDDSTLASFENGMELNEGQVEETTSAGGGATGSGGAADYTYSSPNVWGGGDLTKGNKKKKKDNNSFWKGGKVIQESEYLIDPSGFKKYYDMLNENFDYSDKISTMEQLKNLIAMQKNKGQKIPKEYYPNFAGEALYKIAISMANKLLPMHWNDLPDINSMWDYIDENGGMSYEQLGEAVMQAVEDRIAEEGMSLDDLMQEGGIDEKAKSKSQQKFMGMVHAYKKGDLSGDEVSDEIKKVAKSMSDDDAEDFAATKHKGLPDHVDEANEAINPKYTHFAIYKPTGKIVNGWDYNGYDSEELKSEKKWYFFNDIKDMEINPKDVNVLTAKTLQKRGVNPFDENNWGSPNLEEVSPAVMAMGGALEEHHLSTREEKLAFIQKVSSKLMPEPMIPGYLSILNDASDEKIHDAYLMAEKMLKEKGIDPETITETMIEDNPESMKMQPPITTSQGGDFPSGMQIAKGPMGENYDKKLKEYNDDIIIFENIMKNLKGMDEEKRHSALVLKDRLGKDNQKNFKDDLKHSGTKEIIDTTKELEWNDQQTDVGDDPQKLGMDIEKESIKNTKGEAFKNAGNSTNNEGDEIPKRNLSDDEANEVDLYRKGLGDFVYDNEPDERYKERMKRDMGEEEYKKREARMEFNADAPMYNKDSQPVDDGIEKDQFDKAKSKWNDRMGIKESALTGKYVDELGKTRFFDFNTVNVQEVKTGKNNAFFKVDLTGLGNTYDSKVIVNEGVTKAINEWNFYTDGDKNVFVEKKPVQKLDESEQEKKTGPVNEQFEKMKHLLGYDSNKYINTKSNKNINDIIKIGKK